MMVDADVARHEAPIAPAREGPSRSSEVLVTGATGFVGGWLIPELVSAGHEAVGAPASPAGYHRQGRSPGESSRRARRHRSSGRGGVRPRRGRDPEGAVEVNVGGTRASSSRCRGRAVHAVARRWLLGGVRCPGTAEPAPGRGRPLRTRKGVRTVEAGPGAGGVALWAPSRSRSSSLDRSTTPAPDSAPNSWPRRWRAASLTHEQPRRGRSPWETSMFGATSEM